MFARLKKAHCFVSSWSYLDMLFSVVARADVIDFEGPGNEILDNLFCKTKLKVETATRLRHQEC